MALNSMRVDLGVQVFDGVDLLEVARELICIGVAGLASDSEPLCEARISAKEVHVHVRTLCFFEGKKGITTVFLQKHTFSGGPIPG